MRSKTARLIFSASRLRKPSPAARRSTSRSRPSSMGRACWSRGDGPRDFARSPGKKIGVLAGTTTEQSLRDTLASAGIAADVTPAKTHEEGLAMLDKGEIVAYFGDRAILAYLASKSSDAGQAAPRQQLLLHRTLCPGAAARRRGFPPRGRSGAEPHLSLGRDRDRVRPHIRRPDAAERHIEDPSIWFRPCPIEAASAEGREEPT